MDDPYLLTGGYHRFVWNFTHPDWPLIQVRPSADVRAEAHRSPTARNRQALVGINKFTRRCISAYRALTSPAVSSPAGVLETGAGVVVLEAIILQ